MQNTITIIIKIATINIGSILAFRHGFNVPYLNISQNSCHQDLIRNGQMLLLKSIYVTKFANSVAYFACLLPVAIFDRGIWGT
jgi:hypothetical protein